MADQNSLSGIGAKQMVCCGRLDSGKSDESSLFSSLSPHLLDRSFRWRLNDGILADIYFLFGQIFHQLDLRLQINRATL